MLPRNLPESITRAAPDELDTSSRRYFLKLVDHTKALNSSKPEDDDNTIRGDCIDGIRLPTGIVPRDIFNLREHLKPRQDDVFIATFPKSGTTWMQQIVKLIWNKGEEDGRDIDAALPWVDPMTPEEIKVQLLIKLKTSLISSSRYYLHLEGSRHTFRTISVLEVTLVRVQLSIYMYIVTQKMLWCQTTTFQSSFSLKMYHGMIISK